MKGAYHSWLIVPHISRMIRYTISCSMMMRGRICVSPTLCCASSLNIWIWVENVLASNPYSLLPYRMLALPLHHFRYGIYILRLQLRNTLSQRQSHPHEPGQSFWHLACPTPQSFPSMCGRPLSPIFFGSSLNSFRCHKGLTARSKSGMIYLAPDREQTQFSAR